MFNVIQKCIDNSVNISYNGLPLNATSCIVNVKDLSYSKTLNSSSNPKISDFLNLNKNSILNIPVKKDGVFDIEFLFLYSIGDAFWETGKNTISKVGIYNLFTSFDFLYLDGVKYEINKEKSTDDSLYLKSPIKSKIYTSDIYKCKVESDCFIFTCKIEKNIKKSILDNNICKSCEPVSCKDIQVLMALKLNADCISCNDKKLLFKSIDNSC